MVITRSAYKKACEGSHSSSDISQNNIIPPWCSAGKVCQRKHGKVPPSTWEIRSSYPLRENIWEYLRDAKENRHVIRKRRQCDCRQRAKQKRKNAAILFALAIIAAGVMASIWITNNIPKMNLLTKVIQRDKLISLLGVGDNSKVTEGCCFKMKYLALELTKLQQSLRHAQRLRRTMLISTQIIRSGDTDIDKKYIEGATASQGSDTTEYGGQIALWGVVPLWRAAPPPDIVLARRKPTPSDCWPFRGSQGEIVIELPHDQTLRHLSVEHIRPDTANSAPKKFSFYGISENGTTLNAIDDEYRNKGPPKQYYLLNWTYPLKTFVFKVLSNQGNVKYTCVYRIHLYGE